MAQEYDTDLMEEVWRDRDGVWTGELACLDCGLISDRDVFEGEASTCPECGSVEVGRVD